MLQVPKEVKTTINVFHMHPNSKQSKRQPKSLQIFRNPEKINKSKIPTSNKIPKSENSKVQKLSNSEIIPLSQNLS